MELACDTSLKIKSEALSLLDFWIYVRNELDLCPKRIHGSLTTDHRTITTFCHNIPVKKKNYFSNDCN
jgi:hypothetical protein